MRGKVEAARFVAGETRKAGAGLVSLRNRPDNNAEQVDQLRFGDDFTVYEEKDGWTWGQSARDRYVGYVPGSLLQKEGTGPTHRVTALFAFLFSAPSIKSPVHERLPFLSQVTVAGEKDDFFELKPGGFVHRRHLAPLDAAFEKDPVDVARRLMGVPYLWGGASPLGCDCSGLVQLALESCGVSCPRDSDMQAAEMGHIVMPAQAGIHEKFRRGDLIFFKGHVGIMADEGNLLHANMYHGCVAVEPLEEAVERIGAITVARRLG